MQAFSVVESSKLSILLSPLQLAVIVCIGYLCLKCVELNHFPNHLFGLLVSGGFVRFKYTVLTCL